MKLGNITRRAWLACAAISLAAVSGVSAQVTKQDSVYRLPDLTRSVRGTPAGDVWRFAGSLSTLKLDEPLRASGRLDQAFQMAPGVMAQSRSGGVDLRIVIRGFGSRGAGDRSNAGTMRGIRVLVDGFPETEPDGRTALDLLDMGVGSSLQVLRSNASASWGNAAGGVIALSTLPTTMDGSASAQFAAGGFGLYRGVTRATTSLGSGVLFAGATHTSMDGWRANSQGERTLVNLGFASDQDAKTTYRFHLIAAHNKYGIPGPLTQAQVDDDPQQANATYLTRLERRDNKTARFGGVVTHQLNDDLSVSVKGFITPKDLQRSERNTFRFFDRVHRGASVTAEDHIGSAGTLTAGFDWAKQDGEAHFWSLTAEGTQGTTLQQSKNEIATNTGAFLQHEITLGSKISLSTGVRWDDITYGLKDSITPKLDAERSFSRVTPKVGITYRLASNAAVFATLGGGVEAPAANETDSPGTFGADTVTGISTLLSPIKSTTVEVGVRQRKAMADGAMQGFSYEISAYQTKVRNEVVPYRGGRFYFTAGRATRKGLELSTELAFSGGIGLTASATLQDHKYTEYVVDSVHYGKPGASADYSGNKVVGAPSSFMAAELRIDPSFAPKFRLALGAQTVSNYWVDDANSVEVPRSTTASLGLSLREPVKVGGSLGVSGSVTVQNLLDRKNIGSAFLNPDLVGGKPAAFEPALPRHVVVGFTLGWMN